MTDDAPSPAVSGELVAEIAEAELAEALEEATQPPELLLERLSSQADAVALFPASLRDNYYFAFDLLLNHENLGRYVKKLIPEKTVCIPNHRLAWKYYYPLQQTALPTLERTNRTGEVVWGLLFNAARSDFSNLEEYLRVPNRYHRRQVVAVDRGGRKFPAFTYVLTNSSNEELKPSRVYLDALIKAARDCSLPEEWLSQLAQIPALGE